MENNNQMTTSNGKVVVFRAFVPRFIKNKAREVMMDGLSAKDLSSFSDTDSDSMDKIPAINLLKFQESMVRGWVLSIDGNATTFGDVLDNMSEEEYAEIAEKVTELEGGENSRPLVQKNLES